MSPSSHHTSCEDDEQFEPRLPALSLELKKPADDNPIPRCELCKQRKVGPSITFSRHNDRRRHYSTHTYDVKLCEDDRSTIAPMDALIEY